MTTNTDVAMPELPKDLIRAVGGIVHGDGNIFFTNQAQLDAYARAAIQQAAGAVPEGWKLVPLDATPEMIAAYLSANTLYWHRTDELPSPPDKWRAGTPTQATAEGYRAMLNASHAPPKQQPVHLGGGECGGVTVTLAEVEQLAKTMWRGEVLPGRVLRFGAAVLGLADAATGQINKPSGQGMEGGGHV